MKKYSLFIFLIFGCSGEANIQNLAPASSSTVSTQADIRSIVSYGNNLSFNNRTGGVNDMAMNPVTNLPAVVYHDQDQNGGGTGATPTTGALKYAYMDSSGAWNIEVVDVAYGTTACGAASSFCFGAPNAAANVAGTIRLAFKSDGTPAVAYVFGASLTGPGDKEIRFAERSTAGNWTLQRAFTSTIGSGAGAVSAAATVNPLTGLTLLFDSQNRPHISFTLYASTILSSSIKYLFRSSAGVWSVGDISAVPVAGATAAVTATTGVLQAGAAWCSAGSPSPSAAAAPVYVYQRVRGAGGHGNPIYITCTNVATSGACTAWNVLDLVNGCAGSACSTSFTTGADNGTTGTNAGTRADLLLDPTTNRPIIGLYSVLAPATSLITITAPNACNVAQSSTAGSWGAANVVEASSAGANGFKLALKNSSNLYATYIFGTTSVRQSRSTNGGVSWFATGHIIETPATVFGGQGVGAIYSTTDDMLYGSYATQGAAGAIGNDIRVAYVDPDDLISGGVAGANHIIDTVDQTGNAFPAPIAGSMPLLSAAKASNGTVGYAYYFHDRNGVFADSKLYYGVRTGSSSSPVFIEKFVANHQESSSATAAVGLSPSLAYDSNSNPAIAFYNSTATELSLNVARSANGGNTFSISVVDDSSADVGRFPSLSAYGSYLGVAYRDETNTALKFARRSPSGQWKRFVVDGMAGAGGTGCGVANAAGQYAKLAISSTGLPVIAYQDDTGASSLLRLAVAAEAISSDSFTWRCITIDSGAAGAAGYGEGIDITLDSSDRPHLVHFNFATGDFRYLTSSSPVATAVALGSSAFTASIVTNVTAPTLAAGSTNPSIGVSTSGVVYIAMHDVQNRALTLGQKAAAASAFTLEQVEQAPNLGGITTPFSGQYPVLLLNGSSLPMIFYRSWENWIRYFSRETN